MRIALLGVLISASAFGTRLPIRTYTTADGLPRDLINRIVRDSRGFLWFCTGEGISRFDGYQFINYGREHGLGGVRDVYDLLETRSGNYLVATKQGLFRFQTVGGAKFTPYPTLNGVAVRETTVAFEDHSGRLWIGSRGGLYEAEEDGMHMVALSAYTTSHVHAIAEDPSGALWIATTSGLLRKLPDGRVQHYTRRHGLPADNIESVLKDRTGRLWIAAGGGMARLVANPQPDRAVVENSYSLGERAPANYTAVLLQASDGRLWAGGVGALAEFDPAGDGSPRFIQAYTPANGLTDRMITSLAEDRQGNLWVGTQSTGAMKIQMSGVTSFGEADGVGAGRITSIQEDREGRLMVYSQASGLIAFDGSRFHKVMRTDTGGAAVGHMEWDQGQFAFQARNGEWWVPTEGNVWRYGPANRLEGLTHPTAKVVLQRHAGRSAEDTFRIYEDHRGDIWIARVNPKGNSLARWDRTTGTLHEYTDADGWPDLNASPPTVFCEDRSGRLWIGHRSGVVIHTGGSSPAFRQVYGSPAEYIRDIYLDSAGRIWIGSVGSGLFLVDPDAEHPRFVHYGVAEGLSENQVRCITEDRAGRIYVGTPKGVDRIEPGASLNEGRIAHYTTSDGLNNNYLNLAFRDHGGALWFGTLQGLSRLIPEQGREHLPPLVLFDGVRIRGTPRPMSPLGEAVIPRFTLGPNQNQVEIDFVALGFATGDVLRYQYKLEGADDNWSVPSDRRSVNYATLAPGAYRFAVRAINADGMVSPHEASAAFTILAPVWRRWWFELLATFTAAGSLLLVFRYRLDRLREMDRMRMRIATDLHDDVGASLSQIAILSEVARRQTTSPDSRSSEPLLRIGGISRELIDSFSDIVWAINPQKDPLIDVVRRMRQFAGELFVTRNIEFTFVGPEEHTRMRLDVEKRREVYLIFKECANNIVRHSGATQVSIRLGVGDALLLLKVQDNGRGFDPDTATGHGLASMRERARRMGGAFRIVNGGGTTATLEVPLHSGRLDALMQRLQRRFSPHPRPSKEMHYEISPARSAFATASDFE